VTVERRGSLRSGWDALAQWKLILLLTATTAVLGLLAATPLAPSFQHDLAGTLAGDHLLRNEATLAPTDAFDFLRERRFAIAGAGRAAGLAGTLGVVLQAFFAGGLVAVLGQRRFSFGQFVEPARRNFWHNAKCLVVFLLAAVVLVGGWLAAAVGASKKLLENAPPDAPSRSAAAWGTAAIGLILFAVLSLVYDFARAARRYAPTIGAWRSFRFALRVLRGAWPRALALFLFWLIVGAAALFAGVGAAWTLPAVSLPAVVLLVVVQIAALGLRSAVRVATWGSYIGFLEPRARRALASLSS